MRRLLLSIAVAACGTVPTIKTTPRAAETPWCAAYVVRVEGVATAATACGQTRDLCERQRAAARRYGGLAEIVGVGECRWEAP